VKIRAFTSSREEHERDDVYWVNYYPNGMCDAFTIRAGGRGAPPVPDPVDPLSGRAKVEYD